MKYFCTIYVIYNDGTADKKAMYDCDSADTAIASAHKYMGNYMAQNNVEQCLSMAVNTMGDIYANYHWTNPNQNSQQEDAAEE